MSLLMQALKKAEEAKRLADNASGDANNAHATVSVPPQPASQPASLPDLAAHIDTIDSELASASMQRPDNNSRAEKTRDEAAEEERQRSAARNLFEAKHAATKADRKLIPLIGLALFIALGAGGYFWWQLRAIPSQGLAPSPSAKAAIAPAVSPERSENAVVAAQREARLPANAGPSDRSVARLLEPAREKTTERAQKPPSAQSLPAKETKRAEAPRPDDTIRLSKAQPRIDPALEHAYAALMAGRLDEAQSGYERVVRNDAKNTDALLGLATIAAQRGASEHAQAYYLRALESDPTHPTARAGVASTQGLTDAERTESRLKVALSEQPGSAPILFALGNLYARQGRWSEAQQAYFQAYAADPENPDFIFNVAVSLDQLRKSKLAAQYYQMALSAAEARPAGFDRAQVENRLHELQP